MAWTFRGFRSYCGGWLVDNPLTITPNCHTIQQDSIDRLLVYLRKMLSERQQIDQQRGLQITINLPPGWGEISCLVQQAYKERL